MSVVKGIEQNTNYARVICLVRFSTLFDKDIGHMSFAVGTYPPSAYFCCDRSVLRWPSETYELITCDLQPIWEKEKTYATHWFCAMTPFIHVIFTGVSCRHACTVAHQQSKNKMHTRKAIEHDEIGWETL